MKTFWRVLEINHITYHKHYIAELTDRTKENYMIVPKILHIFSNYNKHLGDIKLLIFFNVIISLD